MMKHPFNCGTQTPVKIFKVFHPAFNINYLRMKNLVQRFPVSSCVMATLLLITVNSSFLRASVTLPGVLSSNMIFQRNKEIKIWGIAAKGEKVTVTFNEIVKSVKAGNDGKWMLVLPAMKEGVPYTMVVKGENTIELDNILIGDVWVCSGQSNMEWPLRSANNAEKEIESADYPGIRLLNIPKNLQYSPVEDIPGIKWDVCSPQTVAGFSAVGYFFGREIYRESGIPIGLINTSWGGTVAEAWTSGDFLSGMEDFRETVANIKPVTVEELEARRIKKMQGLYSRFGLDPSSPPSTSGWNLPGIDLTYWQNTEVPGLWETNEIGEVDGIIWYRLEVNIPDNLAGNEWKLLLGKIDDNDKTFVNGMLVGETNRYDESREYTIRKGLLLPGINLITVRVEDTGGGGGFWSAKEDLKLVSGNAEIPLYGTWKCRLSLETVNISFNPGNPNTIPSCLYNGMIHPLINLPVTGAIWYQGESNASRAYQYRELFPLMINSWRSKWNQPDMQFYFVQLANFMKPDVIPVESEWAELREAQSMTLSLPNTGMAVIIDIGEENDIHPRNKQDVGYRLALYALRAVYNKPVIASGPLYKSMRTDGNRIILGFETMGSRLVIKDKYGYLKGFAIAGEDKTFYWAKAYIDGDQVIVASEAVPFPVAVRYAWSNNPDDANLYNQEGIPASPFRTDSWQGITYGKK